MKGKVVKKARDLPDFALESLSPDDLASGAATSDAQLNAQAFEALPAEVEVGPERTCIVTRVKGSPEDMIRFVLGPDLQVVADIRRKLPGRGVWVTARADRVAEALKRQAFAKGFRAKVVASPNLPGEVDMLLSQDCLQFLSLVNKSGLVITGFAKVEAAIESGRIAGLLHASDAGADGVRKLGQALRRRFGGEHRLPQIKLFPTEQLDLALGRTNVIHAALTDGTMSEALVTRCRRLASYRSDASPNQDGRVFASSDDSIGSESFMGSETAASETE